MGHIDQIAAVARDQTLGVTDIVLRQLRQVAFDDLGRRRNDAGWGRVLDRGADLGFTHRLPAIDVGCRRPGVSNFRRARSLRH